MDKAAKVEPLFSESLPNGSYKTTRIIPYGDEYDADSSRHGISRYRDGAYQGKQSSPGKSSCDQSTSATKMQVELEPIAIVGMAVRFPQGAESCDEFWQMLVEKKCASTEFPKDRLNIDAFWNPNPKKSNAITTRCAHFLKEDIRAFDAAFFSIPPQEAGPLDPQHRGLLETSYHALENAGIPIDQIAGSNTSVHVGCFTNDFMVQHMKEPQHTPKYSATGMASSILSNRLSWFYDLHGPSMTVDTACSSSLVALDLACKGLWDGSSEMAIVGSANIIFSTEMNISLSNMNFLSPDGRCYSFDDRANGYARGEGFATFVLKPFSAAVRNGDNIRALIRSIGLNQDGYTGGGITQPSKDMQAQLIRETYHKAGLDMRLTRFFEAHGTGTPVGDPTEARAIGECFMKYRSENDPLFVGAVKSNFGHLEGASGFAGLAKAVLAVEKGVIPPNTNFENCNPQIDADFFHMKFPMQSQPWEEQVVRRASVNSFGFGGTNGHVVIDGSDLYLETRGFQPRHRDARIVLVPGRDSAREEFIKTSNVAKDVEENQTYEVSDAIKAQKLKGSRDHVEIVTAEERALKLTGRTSTTTMIPRLVILSAEDESGPMRQAKALKQYLSKHAEEVSAELLNDLTYTLNTRRTSLTWKSYAILSSASAPSDLDQIISKPMRQSGSALNLGLVFTGQGAQWDGMGRELLISPIFRESILRSQDFLHRLGCEWNILDEIANDGDSIQRNGPEFSQIMTTSLQIALADLTEWLGIKPSVVVGHSSGEIAAAYCAGHLSQESAVRVSYYRGVLSSKLANSTTTERHSMASIGLSLSQTNSYLKRLEEESHMGFCTNRLTVSCINSPENVTISGPDTELDFLVSQMKNEDIFARKLKVDVGYHSPQMDEVAFEYLAHLSELETGSKIEKVPMISSVTSDFVSTAVLCRGDYWSKNMVSPVQFLNAMKRCCIRSDRDGIIKKLDRSHVQDIITHGWLEVGPHSALQGPIRSTLATLGRKTEVLYASMLVRHHSATESVLEALGRLCCYNFKINMLRATNIELPSTRNNHVLHDLPQYPFDHSVIHWEESSKGRALRLRRHRHNDFLGSQVSNWNPIDAKWNLIIREEDLPWIKDHKINGSMLYPAAGMLVMAMEAIKQLLPDQQPLGLEIQNVEFHSALVVTMAQEGVETQIGLTPLTRQASKDAVYQFRISVRKDDERWDDVCQGSVQPDYGRDMQDVDNGKETETTLSTTKEKYRQAVKECDHTVKAPVMYGELQAYGLEYGPSFQALDDISFDSQGQAVATILPYKPFEGISSSELSPTVHPSTLDCVFQLMFVALARCRRISSQTMVPTRLSRLWISSAGIGHAETGHEKANTKAQMLSKRNASCSTSVLSEPDLQLKLQVDELEVTAISDAQTDSIPNDARHICHHMSWKVDLDTMSQKQIQDYCQTSQKAEAEPIEWFCDMKLMATCFAAQSLDELRKSNQVPVPSMQRHGSWLRKKVDDSLAEMPHDQRQQRKALLHSNDILSALCDKLAPINRRGSLFVKVGRNLAQILLGEIDPLQLLFSDEKLMASFYEELNTSGKGLEMAKVYLDAMIHKNPDLRFLEIGAGTGATTGSILSVLREPESGPRYENYMFTDVSASFFEKAQERFSDCDRLLYCVLNIEDDLSSQGFEEAQYDVIIAAQVLHATKKLAATIGNTRRLLKPGGKLILLEMTTPERILTGFIPGLLPGWWLGTEHYRRESPCVSEATWDDLLKRNDFSGTDMVFHDYDSVECHGWSLIVSTAISPQEDMQKSRILRAQSIPALILDKRSSFQQRLALHTMNAFSTTKEAVCLLGWDDLAEAPNLQSQHFIVLSDVEGLLLGDIGERTFSSIQKLLTSAKSVVWVNNGGHKSSSAPHWAVIDGLSRVSRNENNKVTLVTLALEAASETTLEHAANQIAKVYGLTLSRMINDSVEPEYLELNGLLCVNRVCQAKYLNDHIFVRTTQPVRMQHFGFGPPLKMGIRAPGLLDTINFSEDDSAYKPLRPDEVTVDVQAVGINFKDCLTLLGRVNLDELGSECAGYVSQVGSECKALKVGDRVAVLALDTYRTIVRAREDQCMKLPDDLSFSEAAAIPTACCTAYFGLIEIARIRQGETVLIHAAAGGTGQAAVQISKSVGAEIFATVGSAAKKKLLIAEHGLQEDHIFYSRDTSFADGIKRMTRNKGVDVVFNSLSGNALVASWECIAPFGRFVEIGRKDIDSRGYLPMHPFSKNTIFAGLYLGGLIDGKNELGRRVLDAVFSMVEAGTLRPSIPLQRFSLDEIEDAFRFLQSGRSSGKIVIEVNKETKVPTITSSTSNYRFSNDATYVISGGLGGIGRSIASWMVRRGARSLILLSRSGPDRNEKAQTMLTEFKREGVNVKCPTCDIADLPSLQRVIEACSTSMAPIKGCFQAAMVLRDSTFSKMSYNEWCQGTKPKIQGSWNLHMTLPTGMDFFIMLSSVCGIFGNGGQSNYAAGNTFQDALAKYRTERGEKAVALDLGIVLGEGFVAENKQVLDRLLRLDLLDPISQDEIFALLDFYCDPKVSFASSAQSQVITGLALPANLRAKGLEAPLPLSVPLFSHMHQIASSGQLSSVIDENKQDIKATFIKASSLKEAGNIVAEALREKVSRVLGLPTNQVNLGSQLESYGVDSLVALELRNWLARETHANLAVFEILGGSTLTDVGMAAAGKSDLKQACWTEQ